MNGGSVSWIGEMMIDCDGSPRAYGPPGTDPLDYLANAGYPGNWWGIVTDDTGRPVIQREGQPDMWPCPGYYVSTTAYVVPGYSQFDCRCYLDSEKVCFIVVPGSIKARATKEVLGCRSVVTDIRTGKTLECVCGDVGPSKDVGEASMAVAKFFGVNPDPKIGGSSEQRWRYEIWPGVAAEGFVLQ